MFSLTHFQRVIAGEKVLYVYSSQPNQDKYFIYSKYCKYIGDFHQQFYGKSQSLRSLPSGFQFWLISFFFWKVDKYSDKVAELATVGVTNHVQYMQTWPGSVSENSLSAKQNVGDFQTFVEEDNISG